MRFLTVSLSLLALAAIPATAATAINALRVLTPEQARNVALIAARDGSPDPDRWHILVYDPNAEAGLREFVITGTQRTANRQLSQFAQRINGADVFGPDAVKIDSDRAARVALQFGTVNNLKIAAMHYDLRKGSADGPPLWTVMCVDNTGAELGRVIISATRGTVVMHPGFSVEPRQLESVAERATTSTSNPRPDSQSGRKASPPKKVATPLPVATPRQNLFQRLFGGNNPRNP